MSSGVEADIALDAAVVLSLGMNRVAGKAAGLTATGAEALAALAQGRADARAAALAEAERQDRAMREVIDRNARIAVLADAQREDGTSIPLPAPLPPGDQTPEELAAWCAATDRALEEAETRIRTEQAAQATAMIFNVSAESLRTELVPPQAPTSEAASAAESSASRRGDTASARQTPRERDAAQGGDAAYEVGGVYEAGGAHEAAGVQEAGGVQEVGGAGPREGVADVRRAVTLARVLARLAPDTAAEERAHVGEAARRMAEATTDSEAEAVLSEVRLRVQKANETTARRREEERRARAEREAKEQSEAEREYVLNTVTAAFEEMGYEVDAGFETMTARDGELILTRGAWPDHSVRMRVDDARAIRAAMVRTRAPESEDDRLRDAEREREWCAAFENARERLAAAGVRAEVTWRIEPGDQELPVTARARQTRSRTGQQAKQREREI